MNKKYIYRYWLGVLTVVLLVTLIYIIANTHSIQADLPFAVQLCIILCSIGLFIGALSCMMFGIDREHK